VHVGDYVTIAFGGKSLRFVVKTGETQTQFRPVFFLFAKTENASAIFCALMAFRQLTRDVREWCPALGLLDLNPRTFQSDAVRMFSKP
jgi:hypothetical protein